MTLETHVDRILASWSLAWDQLASFVAGSKLSLLYVSCLVSEVVTEIRNYSGLIP
jgi:hypothetical protein